MALINDSPSVISGGFEKELDRDSQDMLIELAQAKQYEYPLRSSVREIVCNGIDAIAERNAAIDILSGTCLESDYYETVEGDLYKGSRFDAAYYHPSYLCKDNNVYIEYSSGEGTEKDKLVIRDNGVGLGGLRLQKYFDIGWSSKRLSRVPIGKFGIGAKAPLSVNPYYVMESRYNGKVYRFMVYTGRKVESIVPRFDLKLNIENQKETLPNGQEIYYETTEEPNGVAISIDMKKHYKQQVIEAVQSQLMYFDNIVFKVDDEEVDYKATIFYEDEHLVISDNNYYAKPHILLNKINYGYVNWQELEMEDKLGNVALKISPEDVDIAPSRERLIWMDKTKEIITKKIREATNVATKLVEQELTTLDFLEWYRTCSSLGRYADRKSTNIVGRLAAFVDMNMLRPRFNGTDIKYEYNMFDYLDPQYVTYESGMKANARTKKVKREKALFLSERIPVVIRDEETSNKKDKYLLELYPSGFYRVKESVSPEFDLLANSSMVLRYSSIVVPDTFKGTDAEEDEETIVTQEKTHSYENHILRRKLEGKVVIQTPRMFYETRGRNDIYEWQKDEISIKSLNDWDKSEIYYGHSSDADTLKFVAYLTRPNEIANSTSYNWRSRCEHYNNDMTNINLVLISMQNTQYFDDFLHINKFFYKLQDTKITMSQQLIKWNTARLIMKRIHKLNFLYNYSLDPEKQKKFRELREYIHTNYRNTYDRFSDATDTLVTHLDKIQQFQEFVRDNQDPERIAELSKQMFSTNIVTDAQSIDLDLYREFEDLLEWSAPIAPLLNKVYDLCGTDYSQEWAPATPKGISLSFDLEQELIFYTRAKNIS